MKQKELKKGVSMSSCKEQCKECGAPLTAEERLLNAIFGEETNLCPKCVEEKNAPKCSVCRMTTYLSINGEPRCKTHMGAR